MASLSNLPDHLVVEIFSRLAVPVKDLIVLTSVCKSWLALISSPSFVESHFSRNHLNPENHLLLLHDSSRKEIVTSPINFSGNPHKSVIPIPASGTLIDASETRISRIFRNWRQFFVGSINGLVCFSRPPVLRTIVVIWNPATHRSKDILVPHFNIKQSLFRILVGFGFNCVANDYKIVCIYEYGYVYIPDHSYQFHMYSCNDNSWKELKHDFPLKLGFVECVTVKGNAYWVCFCPHRNDFWVKVNVETEEIKMFEGPEYVMNETTSTSILALGDSIAEAIFSPGAESNFMVHVYTFEENSGVWMRMYAFELLRVRRSVSFKCYKNGKIIFTEGNRKRLYMYNLASRELKNLMVTEGKEMHSMPINYTESLVSIDGMMSVRDEATKEERQEETAFSTTDRFLAIKEKK